MSVDDINNKYLKIGYQKRKVEGDRTKKYNRLVMGRKGIGKLSLFSIAKKIYVMSVDSLKVGQHEKVGLILDLEEIQEFIRNGSSSKETYYPIEIDEKEIDIAIGTKIILTELTKKTLANVERYLRRRIARRFSIIGENFQVFVNDIEITLDDRDYFTNLQYIWYFG